MPRLELLNILLILFTCVLAHIFPYHLLIFSYAVFGPLHYLTQISWLHDRRYFVNSLTSSTTAILMIEITLLLLIAVSDFSKAFALGAAIGLALLLIMPSSIMRVCALLFALFFVTSLKHYPAVTIFMSLMLPTVVHVFFFTACFMFAGALKSKQVSQFVSVLLLIICSSTFLISVFNSEMPISTGVYFFMPVAEYLRGLLNITEVAQVNLFGFLSFAYTYHYLNWFLKVEVIKWHNISRLRILSIAIIYSIILMLYGYNYMLGFEVALFLSVLHVLLELPLNLRTFAFIGKEVYAPFRHAKKVLNYYFG